METINYDRLYFAKKNKFTKNTDYFLEQVDGSRVADCTNIYTRKMIIEGLYNDEVERVSSSRTHIYYHYKDGYTRKIPIYRLIRKSKYQA